MSVMTLEPSSGLLEPIAEHVSCPHGFDFHTGSTEAWWTKLTACLLAAVFVPYLLLLILIAISIKPLAAAISLAFYVFVFGWLVTLPCILAVLMSAFCGKYFIRALTIVLPFFLLVGWETLGTWWNWQDEESRLHNTSFGDELLNWVFCAGQSIWTSGIKYLLCAVGIRLLILLTGRVLRRYMQSWYHRWCAL